MRVYKRKNRWYVERSYNGKRYRKVAGSTKREALSKLGMIQRRIELEERKGAPANAPRSFAEYTTEYLSNAKTEKAETTYVKDSSRMNHLIRAFGDKNLNDITVRDVERYKEVRSELVKPTTVNRELTLLSHMFRKAIDWNYYRKPNPVHKVKKCKEPPGRIRYLTLDEREQLLEECKRSLNPFLYDLVMVALETGMRLSEQKRLKGESSD